MSGLPAFGCLSFMVHCCCFSTYFPVLACSLICVISLLTVSPVLVPMSAMFVSPILFSNFFFFLFGIEQVKLGISPIQEKVFTNCSATLSPIMQFLSRCHLYIFSVLWSLHNVRR